LSNVENCAFCDRESLKWRTVREGDLFISFISKPRFREGQCLVIPTRHITAAGELTEQEGSAVMAELGRLSTLLDNGYGSGIMQKYQPLQAENGVKMNHLHFHVFPRIEDEPGLFPTPDPNSFEGFSVPTDEEVVDLAARLK
jgi:histidine triad (HIT) family protein